MHRWLHISSASYHRYASAVISLLNLSVLHARGGSLARAAPRPLTVLTFAADSIGVGTFAEDSRRTLRHQIEDHSRGTLLILNHSYGGDWISGNAFSRHVPNGLEISYTGGIPVIMLVPTTGRSRRRSTGSALRTGASSTSWASGTTASTA